MKVELTCEVYFWNKETNYLFDFNSSESEISVFKTKVSGNIIRNNNEILFVNFNKSNNYLNNKFWSNLWQIQFFKDETQLIIPENQQDKTYLTIKHSFKNEEGYSGYKIKIGDNIKFGKMTIICKEIKINNNYDDKVSIKEKTIPDNVLDENNHNNLNLMLSQNNANIINNLNTDLLNVNSVSINNNRTNRVKKTSNVCRICLSEDSEPENPLITPCRCSGTMRAIHVECLRDWLKSKIIIKTYTHMTSYTYRAMECELCLMTFPLKVKMSKTNKVFDLIFTNIPTTTSYVIFDQVVKDDQEKTSYLVMFKDKNSLKIGRSNDSDFRLSDISISRYHADINLIDNNVYIDDNDSKFGSLLLLQNNVSFILNQPIGLQIGKHFITMDLNKTFLSMLCCNK